jgi:peptidoglycan DL-endopeptidase LytE
MPIIINQINKSLFILIFFIGLNAFSQEKTKKHKIQKGETITSIAKENNISINEIYELNPDAKKVLKLNSILIIPISKSKKEKKYSEKEPEIVVDLVHQVAPKETFYGISKNYKISIENLKKWNPILENSGLEIGQIINVAENKSSKLKEIEISKSSENSNSETKIHEVLAKETLYSLSKKYKISIPELEKLNPEIKNGLPIGFKLIIAQSKNEIEKTNPIIEPEKIISKNDSVKLPEKIESEKEILKSETEVLKPIDSITVAKPITNLELSEQLFVRASEQIGSRYRSGGTQPGAFDCSGLMIYTFLESGIQLPRTSAEQSRFGTKINNSEAQKGDLIFFSTNGRGNVNHVGMVIENIDGEIKFIHSSVHGGVIISALSEKYYVNKFKHINRVLE